MESFATPVRMKAAVVVAAIALTVVAAVTRDVGRTDQATPADAAVPAVEETTTSTADEQQVPSLDIDDLEPGQGVEIAPLEIPSD